MRAERPKPHRQKRTVGLNQPTRPVTLHMGANAFTDSDIPKGHTRIALLDPKTNAMLWSDTHKTEGGKVKTGHLLDGLHEAFDSYEKSRR